MKYSIINIIYNLPLSNYLGGFIKKKLLKNNRITFIPTNRLFEFSLVFILTKFSPIENIQNYFSRH